jgi:hypothetical protein
LYPTRQTQKIVLVSLLFFNAVLCAADPIIVRLTPLRTDPESIAQEATCDRPGRVEGVNISIEEAAHQTILHCYGHSSKGYTTLFGSVEEAMELLLAKNPDTQTPVRVIGSGCIGLTLALELHRHGFTNIRISTKDRYDIPSWRAGGFFDPGTGKESTPQGLQALRLGLATYPSLYAIEQGTHPYLTPAVVQRMPIYCPATMECEVEILETLNLMPPHELVTLDFGNGVIHEGYKKQTTYFINITELMQQLWANVTKLKIPVVDEEIAAFTDCEESIICNCTGIGSRLLNNDQSMQPMRGHFCMLKRQPEGQPVDYMLVTTVLQDGKEEFIYFIPKPLFVSSRTQIECAGMLGGTFIPYSDFRDEEHIKNLDKIEFAKLAERTQLFFHGKKE